MPAIGNHSIVRAMLTTVLGLGYAAVVLLLAPFLSIVGAASSLTVAISTLVPWPRCCGQPGAASRMA